MISFKSGSLIPAAVIVLFCSFIYCCKKEKLSVSDQLKYLRYFPLEAGQWIEYTADSVVHLDIDDALQIDTAIRRYSFEIREEIDSSFIDGENQQAFIIMRYKREYDSLPWTFNNTWTAKLTANSAQRVEDNIRFIKLEFPIVSSATWNGNAYNFYPEEEYSYDDLNEPAQFGSLVFDSTVKVVQNEFVSLINRIEKNEVYATGVGMIYKQLDSLKTVNTPNGLVILNGLEYRQTIKDYKH